MLDKIGIGIKVGALDMEVFYTIWQPPWVVRQWECLREYIAFIEEKSGVYEYYKGIDFIVEQAFARESQIPNACVLRQDGKLFLRNSGVANKSSNLTGANNAPSS